MRQIDEIKERLRKQEKEAARNKAASKVPGSKTAAEIRSQVRPLAAAPLSFTYKACLVLPGMLHTASTSTFACMQRSKEAEELSHGLCADGG